MIRHLRSRERLWVNITGLVALVVIGGGAVLTGCATCPDTAAGCPPFPIANPYAR